MDENSLQITNIIYEPISVAELGDLSIKTIPSSINANVKTVKGEKNTIL